MSTPDFVKSVSSVTLITILFPSILSTIPSLLATIVTPESNATSLSIPVPTRGDSGFNKGTACLPHHIGTHKCSVRIIVF